MSESQAQSEVEPPQVHLWNPNAAANWSLLFTPAFGAYLQMLNWRALNEPERAAKSRGWLLLSIAALGLYILLASSNPESEAIDGLIRLVGMILLISWYFASARKQTQYVKAQLGNAYIKRSWWRPLLIAVALSFALILFSAIVGVFFAIVSK